MNEELFNYLNDHITIGKYNIYNWHLVHFGLDGAKSDYIEWQRETNINNIDGISGFERQGMITIYPHDGKWRIHFSSHKILFEEYLLIFPAESTLDYPSLPNYCYPAAFSNVEDAKEHIDFFLDKLKKLKAFL